MNITKDNRYGKAMKKGESGNSFFITWYLTEMSQTYILPTIVWSFLSVNF